MDDYGALVMLEQLRGEGIGWATQGVDTESTGSNVY